MRSALEVLMYLAFSAAALPFAWLGVNEALYYHAHPKMLQSRDSALLVLAAVMAIDVMKATLCLAALLAVYFLASGPRDLRFIASALAMAWLATFASALVPRPQPINSMVGMYWDAATFVTLSILPWICAGIRLSRRTKPAIAMAEEGPA